MCVSKDLDLGGVCILGIRDQRRCSHVGVHEGSSEVGVPNFVFRSTSDRHCHLTLGK